MILPSATLDNYLVATYNIAYGNKKAEVYVDTLRDFSRGDGTFGRNAEKPRGIQGLSHERRRRKLARGRNHGLRADGLAARAAVAITPARIRLRARLPMPVFAQRDGFGLERKTAKCDGRRARCVHRRRVRRGGEHGGAGI